MLTVGTLASCVASPALDKLRLFKAAGPVSLRTNQPWLGMAMLACSVAAIDDVPVPPRRSTRQQIEALVSRLGDSRHCSRCNHPCAANVSTGPASRVGGQRRETEPAPRSRRLLCSSCRNGVPFDVAFSLPPDDRLAWVVALGTLDGGEFDWATLSWKE